MSGVVFGQQLLQLEQKKEFKHLFLHFYYQNNSNFQKQFFGYKLLT